MSVGLTELHAIAGLQKPISDAITPKHYTDLSPEPIEVIEAWGLGFCLGNCVKYIARAGIKNPTTRLEDLKKAAWYLKRIIETLEVGFDRNKSP